MCAPTAILTVLVVVTESVEHCCGIAERFKNGGSTPASGKSYGEPDNIPSNLFKFGVPYL